MQIIWKSFALAALVLMLLSTAVAKTPLGKPLALDSQTPIPAILAAPGTYVDRTVQIKGKISEVCQMMGCWMMLVDTGSGQSLRIKVNDGEIVFPKEAVGKSAVAEGKLEKLVLSKEDAIARARHEAEETGRSFDPKSITGPQTLYQVRGSGALILD